MPLTTEEGMFLVEFFFREEDKYFVRVEERFKEQFPHTKVPHCLWLPLLFFGMEVRHAINLIEIRLGERGSPFRASLE